VKHYFYSIVRVFSIIFGCFAIPFIFYFFSILDYCFPKIESGECIHFELSKWVNLIKGKEENSRLKRGIVPAYLRGNYGK